MYFKLTAKKLENFYMEVRLQELVDIVISRVWLTTLKRNNFKMKDAT